MSLLQAIDTQFTIGDDGHVLYQKQASNPLPGEVVAKLVKGDAPLKPAIEIIDGASAFDGLEKEQVLERLNTWLKAHLKTVLELLVNLEEEKETDAAPVKTIIERVYGSMGILPREELEDVISTLDTEMRSAVRARRIRLGPILVFIPALNKPAAVGLRAILWALYNDKPLPVELPKDGIVSFTVEEDAIDKGYYQAIGYPVFGGRAIRIDMLDRVISAVYDAADKGQFKAQHKMAEWLGSSIDGLYAVLEAMGHKKVYDPADEAAETSEGQGAVEAPVEDVKSEADDAQAAQAEGTSEVKAEVGADEASAKPKENVKPELATFRLKKGKAFQRSSGGKKPHFEKKKFDGNKGKSKPKGKKGDKGKAKDRGPRVISAEAKKNPEDSPFAILQQLKK